MSKQLSLFSAAALPITSPRKEKKKSKLYDYSGFVEKFKRKKTTDDCYTPPEVYDAVIGWMKDEKLIDDTTTIVRPFYPGGDYQSYTYPAECVIVDNPPFSIYAQIVRWYLANGIRFFLFGPQLTLNVHGADACFLPVSANIIYANGANINTGFVTNLIKGVRLWTAPSLVRTIKAVQPPKSIQPKHTYPDNVLSCALLGKIAEREVDFRVLASDCYSVSNVDGLRAVGKSLFGSGFLLSDRAAAERAAAERAAAERAAAERAAAERAAAERAAGTTIQLSERELAIINELNKKNRDK